MRAPTRFAGGPRETVCLNPFGPPAISNRDNSWSAAFQGGFITYVVSNRHVVINLIDLVAL